jgi:amidophosphoribosyltransferase
MRNAASSASGTSDAAALTALGLHALQHRGQEATGIVSYDGERFHTHGAGAGRRRVRRCTGDGHAARPPAVGHNRYATTGATVLRNVQPLFADFEFGGLAVAHNGNLTNADRCAARWCAGAACSSPRPTARCSST